MRLGVSLRLRIASARVDGRVATATDHEGLSPPGCHDLYPHGSFTLALDVQVAKRTDVMDLDVHRRPAQFALVREEPLEQLTAFHHVAPGLSVDEDGLSLSLQRYATELRHQWTLAVAPLNHDLEASPFPMLGLHGALVAPH